MRLSLTLLVVATLCVAPAGAGEREALVSEETPATVEVSVAGEAQTSVEATETRRSTEDLSALLAQSITPAGTSSSWSWGACTHTCEPCLTDSDCEPFLGLPQRCWPQCP